MNRGHHCWIQVAQIAAALVMICFAGTFHGLGQSKLSAETWRVLSRMDKRSNTLRTLTADMKETKVTVVVDDESEKNGKLFYKKSRRKSTLKLDYENPDRRTLLLEKGKVKILEPRIKRYQELDTTRGRGAAELRLFWFGQSSHSIRKDYDVHLIENDKVEGQQTSLLELKPKSSKMKALFSRIHLWVDHKNWIPIKTRFIEASEDHLTILLSNVKVNPKLPDRIFKMQVPPDYERMEQNLSHSK